MVRYMKTIILGLTLLIAQVTTANAFVTVTPASMEFGGVTVGTQSEQMFFLDNVGSTDVRVFNCMAMGAFECNLNCFGVLYHGQSCTGTIYFRPMSEHYEFDTVNISMDTDFASLSVHGFGIK
jgi:hypothetical protein